ncbi:MAG TPA: allantoate amidohydrolase [Chloroflexia bacterium]|nr:allantoate amidohydrolase [Chloroflexia bacterium]
MDAAEIMRRADVLGAMSEEPDRLTRRFLTPAMAEAAAQVRAWMEAAGMAVRRDNAGNLIGRYAAAVDPAPALLLGSHIDTVRDAGKYDGPLGVLVAIAAVARLHAAGKRLPFALEVLAFADEEGLRFHTAYLGSKVVAGTFDPAYLALTDADGISVADAIRAAGGDPRALASDRHGADDLLGYLEVHIEQGPVLEAHDLPVGIVTAIAGQSRLDVCFRGQAGHAGTVPMDRRHDALAAAAEFVLAAEALARRTPGTVATVGQLALEPGASNVIPGQVTLSLDVRHPEDGPRRAVVNALHEAAARIGAARGVAVEWTLLQESAAVACAPALSDRLASAVSSLGYPVLRLPSGAGHDAVVMSGLAPVAMLFVRCAGGISHNPAESVTAADVAVALDVVAALLAQLAAG